MAIEGILVVGTEFKFLAPDGRTIHCASMSGWFDNRCESTIQVSAAVLNGKYPDAAQGGEFQVVFAGGFDIVAKESLDARVVSSVSVPGGDFVIYQSSRSDLQGVAVWRGAHHELGAWIPPAAEAVGLEPWARFANLEVADHAEGMTVGAAPGSNVSVTVTDVTNYVEGVGMMYFYGPTEGLRHVPVHQGKTSRAGEIWKSIADSETRASGGQDYFVMANSNAVAVLVPEFQSSSGYLSQLKFLDSLTALDCVGSDVFAR